MRPSHILLLLLAILAAIDAGLLLSAAQRRARQEQAAHLQAIAVSGLGLTDLCLATEARYTRHPAVTDLVAPFMDHPGAMDHFPTGSFWAPPRSRL